MRGRMATRPVACATASRLRAASRYHAAAARQGFTLVAFSASRKHSLRDTLGSCIGLQ